MRRTIFPFVCWLVGFLNPPLAQTQSRLFAANLVESQIDSLRAVPSEASTLLQLALYYETRQPDSALKYAQLALEQAAMNPTPLLHGQSHLIMGGLLKELGAYSKAVEHYFQAIEQFSEAKQREALGQAYNGLGDLYYLTRNLQEALQQHQKALEIAREDQSLSLEAKTLGYLGHFYEKQAEYDKATSYQLLALDKYAQLNDPQGLSTINGYLGSIYEDRQDYEKAHYYFSQALSFNLQTPNQEERIVHLNDLGDTFRKRAMYPEALNYTQQSLELALKLNNLYQVRSARRDLASIYAGMGQYEKAYTNLENAYELHENLFDAEAVSKIARLQSLQTLNETRLEVENLKRNKRMVQIGLIVLLVGLLWVIFLAWLAISRKNIATQKDRELMEARQALVEQELENSQLRTAQLQSELEASSNQLSTHALSIVQKNKILKDIKTRLTQIQLREKSLGKPIGQLIKKIDEGIQFDKDWKKFNQIFDQVHPAFYRRLNEKYPDLTGAEIRLCALLRLNLDSKDIATILGISQDSLRVSRYRLRKKMAVKKGSNLTSFVMNI